MPTQCQHSLRKVTASRSIREWVPSYRCCRVTKPCSGHRFCSHLAGLQRTRESATNPALNSRPVYAKSVAIIYGVVLALALCGCAPSERTATGAVAIGAIPRNADGMVWVGVVETDEMALLGAKRQWQWSCMTAAGGCSLEVPRSLGTVTLVARSEQRAPWKQLVDMTALDPHVGEIRVEVAFDVGSTVAGSVSGNGGGPVAAARVEAHRLDEPPDTTPFESRTISVLTDAQGRFYSTGFDKGVYAVSVHALGYRSAKTKWEIAGRFVKGLEVSMTRMVWTTGIRGRVEAADSGNPIEYFCVVVASTEWGTANTRRTFGISNGSFDVEVDPGTYQLSVAAKGYESYFVQAFTVASHAVEPEEALFVLKPGRSVRGRVVDAVTGMAIEGAHVDSERRETCGTSRPSITDTNGFFDLDDLPRRPVPIQVTARHYSSTEVIAVGDHVDIELSGGTSIRGRIIGPNGDGLEGGLVRLVGEDDRNLRTTSDHGGRYEFDGVRPGEYEVAASIPSWPAVRRGVSVAQAPIRDLDLRFDAFRDTASVRGVVSGLVPGEQAWVGVKGVRAEVDDTGRYRLHGIEATQGARVRVSTRNGRYMARRLDIGVGQEVIANFAFAGSARLSGQVTRGGEPTEVTIRARHETDAMSAITLTSRGGWYELDGLSDGWYRVSVAYRSFDVHVAGDTRFDVDMCSPGGADGDSVDDAEGRCGNLSISGMIVAGGNRVPLSGVSVKLASSSYESTVSTDSLGTFSFRDLLHGDYILSAYLAGYEVATRSLHLTAAVDGLTLTLEGGFHQAVTVRDVDTGQPLRDEVTIDVFDDTTLVASLDVRLGTDGTSVLPTSLVGKRLVFRRHGYREFIVHSWDGVSLDVRFSVCPRGEDCGGSRFAPH